MMRKLPKCPNPFVYVFVPPQQRRSKACTLAAGRKKGPAPTVSAQFHVSEVAELSGESSVVSWVCMRCVQVWSGR